MSFEYKIVRSKRKTLTIAISSKNEITVRCPLQISNATIEDFVNSKADWIYKITAENNVRIAENYDILTYKKVYVGGSKLALVLCGKNEVTSDAVYVKSVSSVKKILSKTLSKDLLCFAEYIAKQVKMRFEGFSVRSYKSRWGCCDKQGAISLNCLLVMLPLYLQRYVIIHELCHTVQFNHSLKFWKLVEKLEPNYKLCRKNLKRFDYLIKLY